MDHWRDAVMQDATNVDDLFAQFSARLATAGGIAHRATSAEDAARTIAGLLERAVPPDPVSGADEHHAARPWAQGPELQDVVAWVSSQLVSHQPALVAALEARGLTVRVAEDPATVRDQPLGIALTRIAIAETGSVLLHEREIADRSVSLMTNVLVAICPLDALRLSLDDAAPVLREISTARGSYATLVTGPSRTADIERQLTVGVQGPGEMHVVFVPSNP